LRPAEPLRLVARSKPSEEMRIALAVCWVSVEPPCTLPAPVDFLSTVLSAARRVPKASMPGWSKKLASSEAMKACTRRLGMRS
jgi:hypothetical protein